MSDSDYITTLQQLTEWDWNFQLAFNTDTKICLEKEKHLQQMVQDHWRQMWDHACDHGTWEALAEGAVQSYPQEPQVQGQPGKQKTHIHNIKQKANWAFPLIFISMHTELKLSIWTTRNRHDNRTLDNESKGLKPNHKQQKGEKLDYIKVKCFCTAGEQ